MPHKTLDSIMYINMFKCVNTNHIRVLLSLYMYLQSDTMRVPVLGKEKETDVLHVSLHESENVTTHWC
jgi:hypothetical protein